MANILNGCATIQDAISKYGFPVTVYIHRKQVRNDEVTSVATASSGNVKYGTELHCIQSHDDVSVSLLIDANGDHKQVQSSKLTRVQYVTVRNDNVFYSLSRLNEHLKMSRKQKKKDFTRWVVCFESRPSRMQGISLRAGQYFKVICYKNLGCTTRSPCKRIKVMMYPSREKFWLPSEIEGEFRLCESPRTMKQDDVTHIVQKHEFPLLIKAVDAEQFSYLYGVSSEKVLISCTEDRNVSVFPARDAFLRDVFPKATAIESFSEQELKAIKEKTFFQDDCFKHYIKSFRDLGVLRQPNIDLPQPPPAPITSLPETHIPNYTHTHSETAYEITYNHRPPPPLPSLPVEMHEYEEANMRSPPPLPVDYPMQTPQNTSTNTTMNPTANIVAETTTTSSTIARRRVKSRGEKSGKKIKRKSQARVGLTSSDPPLVPKRETRVNLIAPVKKDPHTFEDNSAYLKYLCTPMLNDPDDTDPETECEDDEEANSGDEDSWSNGSFEDDDYENCPRIQINEITRARNNYR